MQAPLLYGEKKIAKPQIHCPMCNISVRNIHVRSCPNSDLINKILLPQTGFEGNLSNSSKVCFSCYKCQLELHKETQLSSTDSDLSHLPPQMSLTLLCTIHLFLWQKYYCRGKAYFCQWYILFLIKKSKS